MIAAVAQLQEQFLYTFTKEVAMAFGAVAPAAGALAGAPTYLASLGTVLVGQAMYMAGNIVLGFSEMAVETTKRLRG